MPDDSLDIFVRVGSDVSGAAPAREALDGARKSTEQLGEASEKASQHLLHGTSSGKAFHKVLHQITESSPMLGAALQIALNPVGGTLMTAAAAFHFVGGYLEELNKKLDEIGESASHGFGDMKLAVRQAQEEVAKAQQAYDDWKTHLTDDNSQVEKSLNSTIAKINEEAEAVRKLRAARLEEKKAEIVTDPNLSPEQKTTQIAAAEAQATTYQQASDKKQRDDLLAAKEKALADNTAKQKADQAAADKAQAEANALGNKTQEEFGPDKIDDLQKQRDQLEKERKAAQDEKDKRLHIVQDGGFTFDSLPGGPGKKFEEALNKFNSLDNEFQKTDKLLREAREKQAALGLAQTQKQKDADRAKAVVDADEAERKKLEADVKNTKASNERADKSEPEIAAVNAQTKAIKDRAELAKTPIGAAVVAGAEAEGRYATGKPTTAADDKNVSTLGQALAQAGLNPQAILAQLQKDASNPQNQNRDIIAIVKMLDAYNRARTQNVDAVTLRLATQNAQTTEAYVQATEAVIKKQQQMDARLRAARIP